MNELPGLVAHPDAELIVTSWLRTHPALVALGPLTVAADLRGHTPGSTRVVVTRTGGTATRYLDRPRLDLQVWAPDKFRAHQVAQTARAVVHDLAGRAVTYQGGHGQVTAVTDEGGPLWLPDDRADPTNPLPRYVVSLRLTTRGPTTRH